MTLDRKTAQEQITEEFRRIIAVTPAASLEPIPRETHRAVVLQVLERAWTAERELKDFRRRLVELDLCYQATLADLAAERLKVLKLEKARIAALKDVKYWVQRHDSRKGDYTAGWEKALEELVGVLEKSLKDPEHSPTWNSAVLWVITKAKELMS